MKRIGWAFFALALAVTGCGQVSPTSSAAGPDTTNLLYRCSEGPAFSVDVFDEPATAELANSESGDVLRAFLAGPDGRGFLPQRGWWLAGADAQAMTFIAREPGGPGYVNVSFASDAGGWRLDSYGSCRASVVLANGLGTASWMLDPEEAPPGAGDSQFTALVTELSCASGQSSEGRIAPPTVLYEAEQILVIFAVRPLPGAQLCPGNPATRYLVQLTEPIGERRLLDGSFLPSHDPTQPLP